MRSTKPGNSIILFAILSLSPVFADLGPNSDELGRALYDESYICVKLTKASSLEGYKPIS